MKTVEACLTCEILILKYTPHGKKKKKKNLSCNITKIFFPFISSLYDSFRYFPKV